MKQNVREEKVNQDRSKATKSYQKKNKEQTEQRTQQGEHMEKLSNIQNRTVAEHETASKLGNINTSK